MGETIWYQNLNGLITSENVLNFFPTQDMTLDEQLNSVVRFALYFTVLVVLVARKFTAIYFLVFVMAMTVFVSKTRVTNVERLTSSNPVDSVEPTADNPFMNVLSSDYKEHPKRGAADDVLNPSTKLEIEDKFSESLYCDANDIFNKNASERQFYTTAITTIPNDQEAFATWCYGTRPTCKEKTLSCWAGPPTTNAGC